MSQLDNSTTNTVFDTAQKVRRNYWSSRVLGTIVVLSLLLLTQPAAAQESAVCSAEKLPAMIEGFFQLTTGIGIIGLVIVWQGESVADIFTMNPDQKREFKRHKRSALRSAVIVVTLGPLYTVAGPMMGLPLAECINLAPW